MIGGLDSITIKAGDTQRLHAIFVDASGALKTGLTVTLRIDRKSDGKYLKNDGTWTASPSTEYTATQLSATDNPGRYYFDFAAPSGVDEYVIRWDGSSSAANRYQFGYIRAVKMNSTDLHLMKAIIANKQKQAIATGVVTVLDDDAVTTLKTLTPSVDSTSAPTVNIWTPS